MPTRKGSANQDSIVIRHDSTPDELKGALACGRFHYQADSGVHLTAQGEKRKIKRTDGKATYTAREWWYGYARTGRRTFKAYIGKQERVTFDLLNAAAAKLAAQGISPAIISEITQTFATIPDEPETVQPAPLSKAQTRALSKLAQHGHILTKSVKQLTELAHAGYAAITYQGNSGTEFALTSAGLIALQNAGIDVSDSAADSARRVIEKHNTWTAPELPALWLALSDDSRLALIHIAGNEEPTRHNARHDELMQMKLAQHGRGLYGTEYTVLTDKGKALVLSLPDSLESWYIPRAKLFLTTTKQEREAQSAAAERAWYVNWRQEQNVLDTPEYAAKYGIPAILRKGMDSVLPFIPYTRGKGVYATSHYRDEPPTPEQWQQLIARASVSKKQACQLFSISEGQFDRAKKQHPIEHIGSYRAGQRENGFMNVGYVYALSDVMNMLNTAGIPAKIVPDIPQITQKSAPDTLPVSAEITQKESLPGKRFDLSDPELQTLYTAFISNTPIVRPECKTLAERGLMQSDGNKLAHYTLTAVGRETVQALRKPPRSWATLSSQERSALIELATSRNFTRRVHRNRVLAQLAHDRVIDAGQTPRMMVYTLNRDGMNLVLQCPDDYTGRAGFFPLPADVAKAKEAIRRIHATN